MSASANIRRASRREPVDLSLGRAQTIVQRIKLAADPNRVRLMSILTQREVTAAVLGEELGLRQPAVSHHLALLRVSGLIQGTREGKSVRYSLTDLGWATVSAIAKLGD